MNGLISIGEFSDRCGLSPKRLRTYAAAGLLIPAAVDPASGYRYYSPDQLPTSRLIDALRQAGIPLADIRAFLREPSRIQLDQWAERLESEANDRNKALEIARRIVANAAHLTPSFEPCREKEASMATLWAIGRTEKGPVRENNEDSVVANDRLALVADGMGGHPGGEVAAGVAAGVVQCAFTGGTADELQAAVRAANWAIWDRAAADPQLEGMGSTICAVGRLLSGDLALVHAGDSRAYLWCDERLLRLTRDHTITAELVERGELRADAAILHPHHGILTRALGVGPDINLDSKVLVVDSGDRLLLCSDGLFNELAEDEIVSILAQDNDLISTVDDLVDHALEHGGSDNISVVAVDVAA